MKAVGKIWEVYIKKLRSVIVQKIIYFPYFIMLSIFLMTPRHYKKKLFLPQVKSRVFFFSHNWYPGAI